ncbi:MAG: ATP-binding protein, partial [Spirochaetaceae bacterium]|nr:ATP-binding protein [Spirochaetaceae bacterium]MDR1971103.1 ATP-binding protein [Treponema sp.]
MLKTWQVSNFKSIREMSEPLEFAPLTIFCGTNSSGKSSLLQ